MKRGIVPAGLALLLLAVFVVILFAFREPSQDRRSVSYWISQLGLVDSSGQRIGETALDKMDPNKIAPYLIKVIGKKEMQPSNWQLFYQAHYHQIPRPLRPWLPPPGDPNWTQPILFIRDKAADYLSALGERHRIPAETIVPKLVPLLDNPDSNICFCAANALEGFGTNAAPAVSTIERLLKNNPEKVQYTTFSLLEYCGPAASVTIPTLKTRLNHTNALVRMGCARVLWRLDPSQADLIRPVARQLSTNWQAGVRIESVSLLWRMDKDPQTVVPVLISLLNADGHPFNYRVIRLLKTIGPEARDAIPAVTDWLNRNQRSQPPFAVQAANEALKAMSTSAESPPSTGTK